MRISLGHVCGLACYNFKIETLVMLLNGIPSYGSKWTTVKLFQPNSSLTPL